MNLLLITVALILEMLPVLSRFSNNIDILDVSTSFDIDSSVGNNDPCSISLAVVSVTSYK